jgi:hypothetical protein
MYSVMNMDIIKTECIVQKTSPGAITTTLQIYLIYNYNYNYNPSTQHPSTSFFKLCRPKYLCFKTQSATRGATTVKMI